MMYESVYALGDVIELCSDASWRAVVEEIAFGLGKTRYHLVWRDGFATCDEWLTAEQITARQKLGTKGDYQ